MNKYQKVIKNWETPFDKSTEEAWEEIQSKLKASDSSKSKVVLFSWKPLISVAAAAAVIVAVVMLWPKNRLIRRATATAQTERIILPDNSVVTLNAGSEISYDEDWSNERTIQLDGQAFFEVVKGGKFSVVTAKGIVEVMGTSFDVFTRKEQFRVECHTGKVKVSAGNSEILITPGNAAELNDQSLVLSNFDVNEADWNDGEFIYDQEPLINVFEELGRQFGVKFSTPDVAGRFYTGRFSNKDLKQALELVCLPMALKFEIQEDGRVIISE